MFKRSFVQLVMFGLIVSLPAALVLAADKTEPKSAAKLSGADEKFVKEAAAGGIMDV
jgi:hypothetical protein